MLTDHTPQELTTVFSVSGVGGGLGFCLTLWMVQTGQATNAFDFGGFIAGGSFIGLILASAFITWRRPT